MISFPLDKFITLPPKITKKNLFTRIAQNTIHGARKGVRIRVRVRVRVRVRIMVRIKIRVRVSVGMRWG